MSAGMIADMDVLEAIPFTNIGEGARKIAAKWRVPERSATMAIERERKRGLIDWQPEDGWQYTPFGKLYADLYVRSPACPAIYPDTPSYLRRLIVIMDALDAD